VIKGMDAQHRYTAAKHVTLLGGASNFLLAILKITIGIIGLSHALFADGVHSLADLVTDALVLAASRVGSKDADSDHQYGHRRIETAATTALAVLLLVAGASIIVDAAIHLLHGDTEAPKIYVLWVALFTMAAKESLFRYTLYIAKKTQSVLLEANAWHHRTDAAASIVVLIGISGALLGYHYFDAIAAVIVALMIMKMGVSYAWSSISELVDTAATPKQLSEISAVISSVPGVTMVHQLRTRSMGGGVLVDVHIMVDADLSVSEGHYIASHVHHVLKQKLAYIVDVTVHVDAEDDEEGAPNLHLPHRLALLDTLTSCWQGCPHSERIKKIKLHYLSGKVSVEIYLPIDALSNARDFTAMQESYREAVSDLTYIDKVELLFGNF
jgi:cation diffusion facilitator family transporter